MPRLPRWTWVLAGGLVVLLALALIVPYLLDVDRYRSAIAIAIEQQTGRKVTLGKISARLLPRVGFAMEGFALGNPPGFPEGNLVTAERIRGILAWGPLLRGEYQLQAVEIEHPQLFLLEDARGRANYTFNEAGSSSPTKKGSSPTAVRLDSIRLEHVELILGMALKRASGTEVVPTLRASGLTAVIRNGTIDSDRLKEWQGEARLAGARLELAGLSQPVLFRSGHFTLRDGAAEARFEADLGKAAKLAGTLRVPDLERAEVQFDVHTGSLELEPLLAGGPSSPAPAAPALPRGRELLARGKFTADRLRWSHYEAINARVDVRVFADRVEVRPAVLELYGGSVNLTAVMERGSPSQQSSAHLEVKGVDVARLLDVNPSTKNKLAGTAQLTLGLTALPGGTLKESWKGKGNFAIRDGKLPGVDLGKNLNALARVQKILGLGPLSESSAGETTFREITGDLEIRQGRVWSQRIHVDSSAALVDLRGSFGFDETLDYDGQATLATAEGSGRSPADVLTGAIGGVLRRKVSRLTVSFTLRGTFAKPRLAPGRGLPRIETASPSQATDPAKKKTILDLFRRP